jgi:hypothetical protein
VAISLCHDHPAWRSVDRVAARLFPDGLFGVAGWLFIDKAENITLAMSVTPWSSQATRSPELSGVLAIIMSILSTIFCSCSVLARAHDVGEI